jgi:hypothetical protein
VLYELTKDDLDRIQINAEALRAADQPGWELGYVTIAKAEWKREERANALSRLLTVMRDTESCGQRDLAFRVALRAMVKFASDHKDTSEYKDLETTFDLHAQQILFGVPVNEESMAGECGVGHSATLASAALYWENRDQGAAQSAAELMIAVSAFLPQAKALSTRADAKLVLSRIFEKQGKYDLAYAAYDEAVTSTDFAAMGDIATTVQETMLTERVRLLSLHQPGVDSTRASIQQRVNDILAHTTLPWSERAELFGSLLRTLELEGMTALRIDTMIHLVQAAPAPQAATPDQEAVVTDFLSRMQGAWGPTVNRPDAALFAYDTLIARTSDQAVRDQLTAARNDLVARMN